MATLGQVLGVPEAGTIRFEETNQNITYEGVGWSNFSNTAYSGGSRKQSPRTTIKPSFKFNFTGSKITLIASNYSDYSGDIQVKIDGIVIGSYSQKLNGSNRVVFFTIDSLESGEHFIEVTKITSGTFATDFNLDAVDILEGESLLPYNENIKKPKLFILYSNQYYYRDMTSWKILNSSPTEEEILSLGMDNINESQILEFMGIYGNYWDVCCWYIDDSILTAKYSATPIPQILTAKNSIQLTGIESATFKWTSVGDPRVGLSVDNGITYYAYKSGSWVEVTNDMSNAMTSDEYSNLTWQNFLLLKGESNTLKHSYYLSEGDMIDDILITASMVGYNKLANESDYSISYDITTKTITYNIKKDGTYSVNYVT